MTNDDALMTVGQLASAMAALGLYEGDNTPAEHAEYAAQAGGVDVYRLRLLNALLGSVQREVMLADGVEMADEVQQVVWGDHLESAKAADDTVAQMVFARWQTWRASLPIMGFAEFEETGPLPVAAAHASEALQLLLGSYGALLKAFEADDVQAAAAQAEVLERAGEMLQSAVRNTDRMLEMLRSMGR
ncbi:DUF6245 family protein [Kitasatospora sp. A2-31]|uniref:DUF6245 family protein n=1 Tax=Kitasatospora sp. A2-31 TaxID=2916414 RepID=UPI001EEC2056|nr:DUF6245 family protein [Kitasatospora sp. A2-31]MCG6498486.1 hypothetical protein [Kitasatospora sp. A2-31]